jgi:hypothetical protein
MITKISALDIGSKIKKICKSNACAQILLDSQAQSGPFDGGCLIFAKAIIFSFGGELVRIESFQTEHYGVMKDQVFYDADGSFNTPEAWISNFIKQEGPFDRKLTFAKGLGDPGDISSDDKASKLLAGLMK